MGIGFFSKNNKLWEIGEAFEEVKSGFSSGDWTDKAGAVAKLTGKTVANAGMLIADAAIEVTKEVVKNPDVMKGRIAASKLNSHGAELSEEKRRELQEIKERGVRARESGYVAFQDTPSSSSGQSSRAADDSMSSSVPSELSPIERAQIQIDSGREDRKRDLLERARASAATYKE